LLVALAVAELLGAGFGASTASAQSVSNPPGFGPGNPPGTGVSVPTPGYGAGGYPYGSGTAAYGARSFYGRTYEAWGYGYQPYYLYGSYSGYTYPSYYGMESLATDSYGPALYGTGSAGAAQWHCMPVGSTIAVPVGQTQPTEGYTGCSYHP